MSVILEGHPKSGHVMNWSAISHLWTHAAKLIGNEFLLNEWCPRHIWWLPRGYHDSPSSAEKSLGATVCVLRQLQTSVDYTSLAFLGSATEKTENLDTLGTVYIAWEKTPRR